MTKQEILDIALGEDFKLNHEAAYMASIAAMNKYAEQESINFTNWSCSRDCNYSMEGVDRWVYKYDVNSVITTTQLYQLYKKETQQTKTS